MLMSCMFSYCSSLTSLNLSNLNTHNVKDMSIKVFILLKLIKIKIFKNFVREILVNCILTSLKEYILDDISYLNIDTTTLYSFSLLPFLEHSRINILGMLGIFLFL